MKFLEEQGYHESKKILIFDQKQIIALMICIITSLILLSSMNALTYNVNLLIYRLCTSFNILMIVMRLINYVFIQKNFRPEYGLPFHLCSYNVILSFLASLILYAPLIDFVYAMSPLAALSALIFPESLAGKYPHFNFRSIEYYTSHTFLIITPMMPMLFLGFKPDMQFFPFFIILLTILIGLAAIANHFAKANYMFINYAPCGTPLKAIESSLGKIWYRIVIISLFIVLYLIMHLFCM